jgi:thiamine biosynthesis lipoprotein
MSMLADPRSTGPGATATPSRHEVRFRAMGTNCHVVVLGGDPDHVAAGEAEVRRFESLWSRFLATSDVGRLNAAAGAPVDVDPDTRLLLERAVEARHRTDGWFDPFMAHELVERGYDRDFADLPPARPGDGQGPAERPAIGEPLRRPAPITLARPDASGRTAVRLHDGVGFDPGGIGKGLAADLVAGYLAAQGAHGVLVNLGGDLRALGDTPDGGWRISVDDPIDRTLAPVAEVRLAECGLCTSSPLARRWRAPDGAAAHHVLDPRTGRPAEIGVASVTVTAPAAWLAETLTTAVMLAGPTFGAALLRRAGAEALVVDLDGRSGRL